MSWTAASGEAAGRCVTVIKAGREVGSGRAPTSAIRPRPRRLRFETFATFYSFKFKE